MTPEVPEPLDGRPVFDSLAEAKEDSPTGRHVVRNDQSPSPLAVIYTVDGILTRTDGPAVIEFRPSGLVARETFYLNNELHRPDGPARITHSLATGRFSATHYRAGARHRINGPAVYSTQTPEVTDWMMFNISLSGRDRAYQWALEGGANRCRGAIVETEFEVLIPELDPVTIFETLAAGVTTVAGVREVLAAGAPLEWVLAFEAGDVDEASR